MKTYTEQLNRLSGDAFAAANAALATMPGGRLVLDRPITLYIDTCNDSGFLYKLEAKTVRTTDGVLEVFGEGVDEKRLAEIETDYTLAEPDEYWCQGGEWYAEWEGLFELLDTVVAGGDDETFDAMPGIENIHDSMQLDSGQTVVVYEMRRGGVTARAGVGVYGEVRVIFRDEVYRCSSQMPEELLKCYAEGGDPEELAKSDGKEYETPYYCDNNNWFEEFISVKRNGKETVFETEVIDDVADSADAWREHLKEKIEAAI